MMPKPRSTPLSLVVLSLVALLVALSQAAFGQTAPSPSPLAGNPSPPAAASPSPADASAASIEPEAPPPAAGAVAGDITLFPRRVIISGRQRVATVAILNQGTTDGYYNINLQDQGMTPAGQIKALSELPEADRARVKGASAFVRYSPRRVYIKAGESQAVRLMIRPGQQLPPGEYRAHFSVAADAGAVNTDSIDEAAGALGNDRLAVRLVPVIGISIPVIVRVGQTDLTGGIRDVKLDRENRRISVELTRAGSRSLYGGITVTAKGRDKPLALIKGIGVYPEIDTRTVTLPLDPDANPALYAPGQPLEVTFTDDDEQPGAVIAKANISAP